MDIMVNKAVRGRAFSSENTSLYISRREESLSETKHSRRGAKYAENENN